MQNKTPGRLLISAIIVALFLACYAMNAAAETANRGPRSMPGGGKDIFKSSFESDQDFPAPEQHTVTSEVAHTGDRSLTGEVKESEKSCQYFIPVEGAKNRRLRFSVWVRSEEPSKCAIWYETKSDRWLMTSSDLAGGRWRNLECSVTPETNEKVHINVVCPSSWGAPPARTWIDDARLVDMGPQPQFTLDYAEDFPALTTDDSGAVWLAVVERRKFAPVTRPDISVHRVHENRRDRVCSFRPDGITGISPPAMAPLKNGCMVAFGAEVNGTYGIYYARVTGRGEKPELKILETTGKADILPALARAGDRVWAVWETNAPGGRAICAAAMGPEGATEPRIISDTDYNSCNPDVVPLPDGGIFACWDSLREENVDIYGRRFADGEWQAEKRLTEDPRIERHPSVAAKDHEVWMAWQAQEFSKSKVNYMGPQQVLAAKIKGDELMAPRGLFDTLNAARNRLLLRPEISFDPDGRLWLSARKSLGPHSGWQPWTWCYSGGNWSKPSTLWREQGRWRGVPLAWGELGGLAAVQWDNQPTNWGIDVGLHSGWKSEVALIEIPKTDLPEPAALQTEPLETPATDFRLADRFEESNANQPTQYADHNGKRLTLYWGDLHEHTDISVCQRSKNPPAPDLYANQRDIEKLDFTAITDHGYNLDRSLWAYSQEQTTAYHDPDRFVTFLAEEWTSSKNPPENPEKPIGPGNARRYGHHNIIFRNPRYPRFFDSYDGDINPAEVWEQLEGDEFIMIPHQLADWKGKGRGNPPTDWSYHHEHHQPLAEIYQARQSYEYLGCPQQSPEGAPFEGPYLQDAWEKGLVIGVIASPDHGGGVAKAGVWAEELTRDSLFEAFHARHTFGTTGQKLALFVTSGKAMMGDKVRRRGTGPIPFHAEVRTDRPVKEVVLFRNNEIIRREHPEEQSFSLDWKDEQPPAEDKLWYYVRVQCEDGNLAWSSPIWFVR